MKKTLYIFLFLLISTFQVYGVEIGYINVGISANIYSDTKKISLDDYNSIKSIYPQLPLNLFWVNIFLKELDFGFINSSALPISIQVVTKKFTLQSNGKIKEREYNFSSDSFSNILYKDNLSFKIDKDNVITIYETYQNSTYPLMEMKLLDSNYSQDNTDFSQDAKSYLVATRMLKDNLELVELARDRDYNPYTSIDNFINDRNKTGDMAITFNEFNGSKYLAFENNSSGILIEKDIDGNIVNSNAGSWIRLKNKKYRYHDENGTLIYLNSPDIIVLKPNIEGYDFDANAFALSSHNGNFLYKSKYKDINYTEIATMFNAASTNDIINQFFSDTPWSKIENIHTHPDTNITISLPQYPGNYENTISFDPEIATVNLINKNKTLQIIPLTHSKDETTILLEGDHNQSRQLISLFIEPFYLNLNLLNINLNEYNITNIEIIDRDRNESFSMNSNLTNKIHDGDINISAPMYNLDNNFSIRIDLENNQTKSYWYNFDDGKLYSEDNGSNEFKTNLKNSDTFTIDLNSTNWITIPVWNLDSNETTLKEDSNSFKIPLKVKGIYKPLQDNNFEVNISDPSILDAVINNGQLIITPKPNQSGEATLTLKVNVDGFTDSTTYTIYIQPQNDTPTISSIKDILKPINFDDFNISFELNDIEGDDLNLTVKSTNPSLINIKKSWNKQWLTQADYSKPLYLTLSSKPNIEGNTTIILTLFDDKGASTVKSFNIQVAKAFDIKANKTTGPAPLDVNFSYYLNPLFGTLNSIHWDFGDGTTSDKNGSILHTYNNVGSYEVNCTAITNKNYILKDSLHIEATKSNLLLKLNKGWSFVSLPAKASLHSKELNETFGKPAVKYIFKYMGNRWALWDNTHKISPSVKIDRFEDLNSKEGFIIRTSKITTITFSLDLSKNDPNDFVKLYAPGWYLVGVNEDKSLDEINSLVNYQDRSLKVLYLYRNDQWFFYTPDSQLNAILEKLLPKIENKISRYESFWIYVE